MNAYTLQQKLLIYPSAPVVVDIGGQQVEVLELEEGNNCLVLKVAQSGSEQGDPQVPTPSEDHDAQAEIAALKEKLAAAQKGAAERIEKLTVELGQADAARLTAEAAVTAANQRIAELNADLEDATKPNGGAEPQS